MEIELVLLRAENKKLEQMYALLSDKYTALYNLYVK